MCELSLQEEMAYGGELFRAVQADFIACIPAVELMDVECISDKLTDEEMQRVKAKCDTEGPRAAARLLLASLKMKRHWFQALMQALDCRYLKLQDFRPKFLQLKEKVDREWMARHSSHSDAASLCSADAASSSPPTRGGCTRLVSSTRYQQHACNEQDGASGTDEDTECKALSVPRGPVTECKAISVPRGPVTECKAISVPCGPVTECKAISVPRGPDTECKAILVPRGPVTECKALSVPRGPVTECKALSVPRGPVTECKALSVPRGPVTECKALSVPRGPATECKALLVPHGPVTERCQVQGGHRDDGSDDDNRYDLFRGPDLHKESWYHGSMERSQAESIMKVCPPGSFLVRYNVKRQHFCLSIVGHDRNLHLKIREVKEPGGTMRYHLDTSPVAFGDIPSLVGFFMQHPVTSQTSAAICLHRPVPKGHSDVLLQ